MDTEGQELGPYEPVPDALVLAAIERAIRQPGMVERAGDERTVRVRRGTGIPWAVLLVVAALATTGVAAGCGGGDDDTTATQPTTETAAPEEETTAPEEETTAPEEEGSEEEGAQGGAGIDLAAGNPKAGEALFADNCAVCHGTKGSGGATGPSLQEPELAEEGSDVVQQIVEGGGGMPPFGDQLSDQEIADVASYVVKDLARR